MKSLETLDILGNPITTLKKYRDEIVVSAIALTTLDGKKVTQQERDFIIALRHKKKIGKLPSKEETKGAHFQPIIGKSISAKHMYFSAK